MDGDDEREEELSSIHAIYPELVVEPSDPFKASLDIRIQPKEALTVFFPPASNAASSSHPSNQYANLPTPPASYNEVAAVNTAAAVMQETYQLSHLPPIRLHIALPKGYPSESAPQLKLSTRPSWLPSSTLLRLREELIKLWEEYGRGQVLFAYIDHLQQGAEDVFGLSTQSSGAFELPQEMKVELLDFDMKMKRKSFEQETFFCEMCLEPKKGTVCYRMSRCGHVFCVACLQDYYNNCITEGDVGNVKCIKPDCGRGGPTNQRGRKARTLNPSELLQIPLERAMVLRYVEIKRKKRLESDKSTIYCPRQWCQGPARSKRHPKVDDPFAPDAYSSGSDDEEGGPHINGDDGPSKIVERLAICENCSFAFCRVCHASWHGDFIRCGPKTADELSAEEKASNDYIRAHTTPCPTCDAPSQKTYGCNHMRCFQCRTHFCYLCCAWLLPSNPYAHFNQPELECYQRLWDLEEGENPEAPEAAGANVRFLGARGAEAAALARERLEAQEAAVAGAVELAAQDRARAGPERPEHGQALQHAMANLNIVIPVRAQDRPAARPAARPENLAAPPARPVEPNGHGLQRFLELAQNDDEDEWDSDELDDEENDGGWDIPRD